MKRLVIIIALLCVAGPLARVQGAIINVPITNYSFETPNVNAPPGYSTVSNTFYAGWNYTGGVGGVEYAPTFGFSAPDGVQVGWVHTSSIWQQTSATFDSDAIYQLSMLVALDSPSAATATAALYVDTFTVGNLLKSTTVSLTTPINTFQTLTVTFGPSDPSYAALLTGHAGQNIIVALSTTSAGPSIDVDNVALVESVPEPTTLPLLGAGGFLLWRKRRSIR